MHSGSLPEQPESGPSTSNRPFRFQDYINLSVYGFGLRGFTFVLTVIIVPVLILDLVPDDRKNAYLGLATFSALMLAIIVQPTAGALSDRFRLPFGRRHPHIVLGTVLACLLLPTLAYSERFVSFLFLLALITIAVNVAQGPFQALIPDLVPVGKRGVAAAFKIGAEILGAAVMGGVVGYVIGRYQSPDGFQWVWVSLGIMVGFYFGSMLFTLVRVREPPRPAPAARSGPVAMRPRDARDSLFPPGFAWYLTSRFLFLAATGILETFGLFYLKDVVQVERPAEAAGLMTVIIGAAALVGALGAGRLVGRTGYRPLIAFSGLMGATGIFLLLGASGLIQVLMASMVVGVAVGIFFSTNWALAIDLISPSRAAQQMGLTTIATAGGPAAAKLLGFGVDALNKQGVNWGYDGLLLVCGVAFLLGGVLVFAVRPART